MTEPTMGLSGVDKMADTTNGKNVIARWGTENGCVGRGGMQGERIDKTI